MGGVHLVQGFGFERSLQMHVQLGFGHFQREIGHTLFYKALMTAEEIEAIVGGYHGDAFRILGPHSVRKRGGQPRWEVRAFLPQAETAEVVVRRPALRHGEAARPGLLLRRR